MQIEKKVLFVSEAAALLGCSAYQIYQLIHKRQLQAYKDEGARAWKIPEEAIQHYINARLKH